MLPKKLLKITFSRLAKIDFPGKKIYKKSIKTARTAKTATMPISFVSSELRRTHKVTFELEINPYLPDLH